MKPSVIWLFAESVAPGQLKWGLRIGRRWTVADKVVIKTKGEGRFQRRQPRIYLRFVGSVEMVGQTATIRGERP